MEHEICIDAEVETSQAVVEQLRRAVLAALEGEEARGETWEPEVF